MDIRRTTLWSCRRWVARPEKGVAGLVVTLRHVLLWSGLLLWSSLLLRSRLLLRSSLLLRSRLPARPHCSTEGLPGLCLETLATLAESLDRRVQTPSGRAFSHRLAFDGYTHVFVLRQSLVQWSEWSGQETVRQHGIVRPLHNTSPHDVPFHGRQRPRPSTFLCPRTRQYASLQPSRRRDLRR